MAIDANKLTEKDELVSQFYTLRAGLSAIAKESNKLRNAENHIQKLQGEINKIKNENSSIEGEIEKDTHWTQVERDRFGSAKRKYDDLCDKRQKLLDEKDRLSYSDSYKEFMGKISWGRFFGAFFVIGIFVFGYIAAMLFYEQAVVPAILSTIVWIMISSVFEYIMRTKEAKKKCTERQSQVERELQAFYYSISNAEDEMNSQRVTLGKQMQKADSKHQKLQSSKEELRIKEDKISGLREKFRDEVVCQATEKSIAIKSALNEQFDAIISEADWENVDLLIFYLNTGRADSLKEALLLVDRQRQTDQIVHAINSAADYVSNTMRENTYRLAMSMSRCFGRLSEQIADNHRELLSEVRATSSAIQKLGGGIDSLGERLGQLSDGIESQSRDQRAALESVESLNRALISQADKSSYDLIKELRYNQRYWVN